MVSRVPQTGGMKAGSEFLRIIWEIPGLLTTRRVLVA